MLGVGLNPVVGRGGGAMSRAQFVARVTALLGVAPVAGYLPNGTDTTTSTCPWSGRTWTADGDMTGQITALGNGFQRAFASASSRYLTTPDTNDLSFNGTTDQPLGIVVLANVTDTAAARSLVTKWAGAGANQREYQLVVSAADILTLTVFDESAAVGASRASDAAITQGAWRLLAMGYSGAGGATAMNGVTLYDNASVASTPTNNAAYVAMENTTSALEIGSQNAHLGVYLDGAVALALVVPVLSTAQMVANLLGLSRQFFGVPT